jgi:CHAT domain-containing protein/tetratricopeptide (TPR) repeat protein
MHKNTARLAALVLLGLAALSPAAAPPQWIDAHRKKRLREATSAALDELEAGRFDRAVERQQRVVERATAWGGAGHVEAVLARDQLDRCERLAKLPRDRWPSAIRTIHQAVHASTAQGKDADAQQRAALAAIRKTFGAGHYETTHWNHVRAMNLFAQARFAEMSELLQTTVKAARASLGEKHFLVGQCYYLMAVAAYHQSTDLVQAGDWARKAQVIFRDNNCEAHPFAGLARSMEASLLDRRGEHRKAELLHRANLEACRKRGELSVETGNAYNALAVNLMHQDRVEEAAEAASKSLSISRKKFGEKSRPVAAIYTLLGGILDMQGKPSEARVFWQRCLEIMLEVSGPDALDTANAYNGLGQSLNGEGRYAEGRGYLERALAIRVEKFGPNHIDTAVSYNNLALCLEGQGRYADAQPLFEKSLTIRHRHFGEVHNETAASHVALGSNLADQGKLAKARSSYREAIVIYRKLGNAAGLARVCNVVAGILHKQGRYEAAQEYYEEALENFRKAVGESHPWTAICTNNLGHTLLMQNHASEALPLLRRAQARLRRTYGEDHPFVASAAVNLSSCLWQLGRHAEGVRTLQQFLPAAEAARYHVAASGFDRAQATSDQQSSRAALAVGLARLGQPVNAFRHAEADLARGLLDDLTAPSEDVGRSRSLRESLRRIDERLLRSLEKGEPSGRDNKQLEDLSRQRLAVLSEMARLTSDSSARQVLPLWRIQRAIPPDAALVLWIDVPSFHERWGCVVRREGRPFWRKLAGTGKADEWTTDDITLARRLYEAVADADSDKATYQRLAVQLRKQRLDPLLDALKARDGLPAVKRLFVVPAGRMASVPAELIAPEYQISYVPSGSVLARTVENHRALDASSLLALGDPAFEGSASKKPAELPAAGAMLTVVQAGGAAERAGLIPGDVLLRVGGVEIESAEDLPAALRELPAEASYWRDGKTGKVKLGKALGARFDPRSAPAAIRAWRQKQVAFASRGTGHKRLPGTRAEVEAIVALVGAGRSTRLLGSDASEQRLDELAAQGKLKSFRVLHFATHGEVDWARPYRSSLIMAQDDLPDPAEQARLRKKAYEGRLTVTAIRQWKLDADLVVLSACETGLGKDAGGDGLLGFSQAFLSRGARSVVLSRWPVHDVATSLLMMRFYQNLLAKRDGLKAPMGRAAALAEAKEWLRKLSAKEAELAARALPRALIVAVPKPWGGRWAVTVAQVELSRGKPLPAPKQQAKPYEHPYYWAAFTLLGDPD